MGVSGADTATVDRRAGPPSDAPLTLIVPVFNEHENFPLVVADIERNVPAPFRLLMVFDFDAETTLGHFTWEEVVPGPRHHEDDGANDGADDRPLLGIR